MLLVQVTFYINADVRVSTWIRQWVNTKTNHLPASLCNEYEMAIKKRVYKTFKRTKSL